ncbi:hypothetical protein AQUSIP_14790 [Aquicella siphonis]|uniref:Radical SAM core domain-containing protein n=1 Tax=Aquicella siphonis TaxID=254247 RepID=A0A5E4PID7_9COXI|nr:PA0069 family radical SAM protein [Aquicella siphonis]VVC76173.1 hypothetical protein AQUSIP_14790 [Aquicella siphonis]
MTIKNRGATINPEGRFDIQRHQACHDGWDMEEEALPALETVLYPEKAKSILTTNDSPDIGFEQSINPYRGCEHGCIYCYARPSHAYMNLSPGLDFETKIFHKSGAAQLLTQELAKPSYQCKPVVLGANTDPYQPAENKLGITRSLLEVFNQCRHPVAIITKSSLIERDLDLIAEMAARNLAAVAVSITTLRGELKRILEPRASSPQARLRVIRRCKEAGIPVRVMAAPMIPMINDNELEQILASAAEAGASHASYTLIRLPHEVKDLFKAWLTEHYPARASHIMSLIRQMRGGKEYDSRFGKRMRGEGEFATLLSQRFKIACKKFHLNVQPQAPLDTCCFARPLQSAPQAAQMDLWNL